MAKAALKWFYNSKAWKQVRLYVLNRDLFTCALCGAEATEVHHLTELDEVNVYDESISLNPENLQSLCHT